MMLKGEASVANVQSGVFCMHINVFFDSAAISSTIRGE